MPGQEHPGQGRPSWQVTQIAYSTRKPLKETLVGKGLRLPQVGLWHISDGMAVPLEQLFPAAQRFLFRQEEDRLTMLGMQVFTVNETAEPWEHAEIGRREPGAI